MSDRPPLVLVTGLAELARDPGRAMSLPPAQARALLLELAPVVEALRLAAQAAPAPVVEAPVDRGGDRWLTPAMVAERLAMDVRQVYRRAHGWPFTIKSGKALMFSERGLERWMARQRRDSD